jgi:hypothetical protein
LGRACTGRRGLREVRGNGGEGVWEWSMVMVQALEKGRYGGVGMEVCAGERGRSGSRT